MEDLCIDPVAYLTKRNASFFHWESEFASIINKFMVLRAALADFGQLGLSGSKDENTRGEQRMSGITLTKDALIEMIRDKVGYPVNEAKEILEIILEEIKAKLEEGKEVKISGFGKWAVKEKRSRPGRNPHTGDKIEISARRVVTFSPSDKLRDAVNKRFAG